LYLILNQAIVANKKIRHKFLIYAE